MSPTFERTLEIALKCASKQGLLTRLDANSGEITFFSAQTSTPANAASNLSAQINTDEFHEFLKRLGAEEKAGAVEGAAKSKFFSTEQLCEFWPSPGIDSRPLGRILNAGIRTAQLPFFRRSVTKDKRARGFKVCFPGLRKFLSTQKQ